MPLSPLYNPFIHKMNELWMNSASYQFWCHSIIGGDILHNTEVQVQSLSMRKYKLFSLHFLTIFLVKFINIAAFFKSQMLHNNKFYIYKSCVTIKIHKLWNKVFSEQVTFCSWFSWTDSLAKKWRCYCVNIVKYSIFLFKGRVLHGIYFYK